MVEKFNFYDIYGYLLPGIAFCGLIWVPFGLLFHVWPTQELSSAILVLVLSYFVGHIIQGFAVSLFPSTSTDDRYPSDLLLDQGRPPFSKEVKKKIEELSQKYFGLPLGNGDQPVEVATPEERAELARKRTEAAANPGNAGLRGEIEKTEKELKERTRERLAHNRNDAFFQARSALLRDKRTSYWEQFEGLYAMMRGLSAALAAAAAYFFGWALGFWHKLGVEASLVPGGSRARWAAIIVVILLIAMAPASAWDQAIRTEKRKSPRKATGNKPTGMPPTARRLQILLLAAALLGGFLLAATVSYPPTEESKSCVSSFISVISCGGENKKEEAAMPAKIVTPGFVMVLLALAAIVASARCLGAYKAFAGLFAEHVWRDFANIEAKWLPKTEDSGGGEAKK
jgi:hypothetical protein